MRVESRQGTIAAFVAEAWREITSLGDELQTWLNGMPENLQESELGLDISEAIENIESGPYEPDVPSSIQNESLDCNVTIYAQMSRATRLANSIAMLNAVIDKCDELKQGKNPAEVQELHAFSQTLEQAKEDWDEIEFPASG